MTRLNFPALCSFFVCALPALVHGWVVNCDGGCKRADSDLIVKLSSGVFEGISTENGTEKWLGIPFAQPPVGDLRFKAPVALDSSDTAVKNASTFGNACPQPPGQNLGAPIGEDCLFLNVWRPEGTTESDKLPVLVWIYGGAYTSGAASIPSYDPTVILSRSVNTSQPIIFASMNYRINTFGFLASSVVDPKDLDAGLLDQRLALQFISDNIASFGGDPEKITIWGQSAGAGSVESHFVYPVENPPFRAGIADSPTGPFKNSPAPSTYDLPGKPFTRLLSETNCTDSDDALACLRAVPFETLFNISNNMILNTLNTQLWEPTIAEGSFAPERASSRIQRGDFLHLPYLAGTNLNEGKGFSENLRGLGLSGAAEDMTFINYIKALLINNATLTQDVLDRFLQLFPANDTSLGAPFNVGDSLWDRASAWYTDVMFLGPRRLFFENAASLQTLYGYYFIEAPIPGNDPALGAFHASELQLLFGPVPESETPLSNFMIDSYLNFIYDLNPGDKWQLYTSDSPMLLQLNASNITLIPDDIDKEDIDFILSQKVLDEFEK